METGYSLLRSYGPSRGDAATIPLAPLIRTLIHCIKKNIKRYKYEIK